MKKLVLLTGLLILLGSIATAAVIQDNFSGKYEGSAKNDQIGELPISAEFKNDGGKLTGKLESPQGPAPVTSGTFSNGKLSAKLDAGGTELVINADLKDDKLIGTWQLGDQKGTFELKKVGAGAAAPAASGPATGGDPVTGDWDATADVQGQAIPFTLKLKLDGDKVTGSSSSDQGTAEVSKGTFSAGKLNMALETPNGSITFTGTIKDGKIDGEFDFAGQMQGKWSAKKK